MEDEDEPMRAELRSAFRTPQAGAAIAALGVLAAMVALSATPVEAATLPQGLRMRPSGAA